MTPSTTLVLIYPLADAPVVDSDVMHRCVLPRILAMVHTVSSYALVMGGTGHRHSATIEITVPGEVSDEMVEDLERRAVLVRPPAAETIEPVIMVLPEPRHHAHAAPLSLRRHAA